MKIYVLTDKQQIPDLIELFRQGLGDTTEEYWEWRLFTDNGVVSPETIVAENEVGKMIGMMSLLPVNYGEHGEYKGISLCDWVVRPECRGQGIIKRMYQFAMERYEKRGMDFLFGFPNENSFPILKKYKYDLHTGLEVWNSSFHFHFNCKECHEMYDKNIEYQVTKACPIMKEISQRKERSYRTPKYFRWKYDMNPETEYQWLSVWKEKEICAYFVFAIGKGRMRTAVNIYDWELFVDDAEILRTACKIMCSYGNFVSIWGFYGEREQKLLKEAGLKNSPANTHYMTKQVSTKKIPELVLTRIDTDY